MNERRIARRIQQGWAAAFIAGLLTLVKWLGALILESGRFVNDYDDPWYALDIILIFSLAFGIYRKSRFCAVAALVYFLGSRIYAVILLDQIAAVPIGLIFLYFHFQGVVGTFQFHRHLTPPRERRTRIWHWVLGGFGGLAATLVLALFAFGALVEGGVLPHSGVVPGEELSRRHQGQLREIGVVREGERIVYFYSAGLFSIKEDGNLFTPDRVVSYAVQGEELWKDEALFGEIDSIDFEKSESFFADSVIHVFPKNRPGFILFVSNEDDGDEKFYASLVEAWRNSQ